VTLIDHRQIQRHFKKVDPTLAKIIQQVGPMTLKPQRDRFKMLVRSILSQQVSTAAAASIRKKLEAKLGDAGVTAESVARLSIDELRAAGLSRQKASYLHDLAAKTQDGTVRLAKLGRMTDAEVIAELIQVKGIGVWSAQMFLIFALGRLDVFPIDDFGVRTAMHHLYAFEEPQKKAVLLKIGETWRPYATIGSWYCWRFLELHRQKK
jgi:DNA-3-methyladenine glycosylase II